MDLCKEATNLEFGRHLVLARAVQAGTVIVKQQPYAAVLSDDQVAQRCDYCFKASDTLMRCSRSKFAHYCCQAHQKAAWRAYYKLECDALVSCAPNIPPATVRLAARVLWRRAREQHLTATKQQQQAQQEQQQQQQQQQLAGGSYDDIEQLHSHWGKLDGARKIMYAQMAALTRQYMQGGSSTSSSSTQQATPAQLTEQQHQQQQQQEDDSTLPDVRHIAQLLARFACNNHTICDDELRPIGVGIYPCGALINHSCKPNCTQSFEGPGIVFRSLMPLSAGEQLTISYVELAATRQERRQQLQQQYFFDINAAAAGTNTHTVPSATPEASQAAEAAAGGSAPAEVQRMLIQCQLPDVPPQQQTAWHGGRSSSNSSTTSAAAPVDGSSSSSNSAVLLSYARTSPPWPEDTADKQLCHMQLLLPTDATSSSSSNGSSNGNSNGSSSSSGKSKSVKLPGGMCVIAGLQLAGTAAAGGEDDAAAAAAAAAAGLFSDLDRLQVDSGLETLDSIHEDTEAASVLRQSSGIQNERNGQCSNKQNKLQLELVQWGDWSKAAAAAAHAESRSSSYDVTSNLILSAANTLLQVWALQQQAEQLAAAGCTAAAVQKYQQAIAVADGAVWAPAATVIAAAAAAAAAAADETAAAGATSLESSSSSFRAALGPMHVLRMRVTAGLLKAAIDEGNSWEVALSAARALVPVYELVYPKVWPNLGLHYALLAKLELLHQHIDAAAAAVARAAEVLQVTHSGSTTVLQEVMRMHFEVQQELAAYEQVRA